MLQRFGFVYVIILYSGYRNLQGGVEQEYVYN